jgi:DNA-binding transcriptional ArsR family regulator
MDDERKATPADVHIITEPETVKIFFDPLRRKITQTIVHTPRTVGQIAEELGLDFRKLYYHIKLLERHGLIKLVGRQLISGAVEEKYYQVSAYQFVIDPALLTFVDDNPAERPTALSALVGDLGSEGELRHMRGTLSPSDAEEFAHRLNALIEEFGKLKQTQPERGTGYSFYAGFFTKG